MTSLSANHSAHAHARIVSGGAATVSERRAPSRTREMVL